MCRRSGALLRARPAQWLASSQPLRIEQRSEFLMDERQNLSIHRVVDPALVGRIPPCLDKPGLGETPEVMADKILGQIEQVAELTVTGLPFHELQEDAPPGRVREQSKERVQHG